MRKLLMFTAAGMIALAGATVAVAEHKPGHPNPKAAAAKAKAKKAKAQQASKVTLCHRTESTENPTRTITVSERAKDAHMAHGDSEGACQNGEPRATTRLTATMTAVQGATGSGTAAFDVRLQKNAARVCYTLDVNGFTSTAAHIHTFAAQTIGGQQFAAGGIVVPLKTPNASKGLARGCTKVSLAVGQALIANPSAFYVNVHSIAFPGGQIQGTLTGS